MPASRLTVLLAVLLASCHGAPDPAATHEGSQAGNAVEPSADLAPGTTGDAANVDIDYNDYQVILHDAGMLVETPGHGVPQKFDESTQAEIEESMSDFGTPERTNGPDDCPAGKLNFLKYPSGLQLAFQDGKFVGYWADRDTKGAFTASGVHPGSPRSSLKGAKIEEASFGKLSEADGAVVVMSDDEKTVEALYAGLACIYD